MEIFKTYSKTKNGEWKVSNYGNVLFNDAPYTPKNHRYLMFGHHIYVHRAVAELFIPNISNKPCVDHIDGNKHNNRADNLRWVTQKENVNNTNTIGNNPSMFKKGHVNLYSGGKKWSDEQRNAQSLRCLELHNTGEYKQKQSKAKIGRHIVMCSDGKRHWV